MPLDIKKLRKICPELSWWNDGNLMQLYNECAPFERVVDRLTGITGKEEALSDSLHKKES